MRRPLIAIPGRFAAKTSALRYEAEVTARALAEAVFAAGGEPLTMHPSAPGDVPERVAWAQGVLLPGGGDLAAHWTGQHPHPSLYDVDEEQDAFDLAVARHCLATGSPLLAICRGLQVVNAARGGRIVQDMDPHHRHRRHRVSIARDSRLHALAGPTVDVSCFHHQCIDRLGDGMRAVAHSEDGVIEAVEIDDLPGWFLGLQWHPEDLWNTDASVFHEFVSHSRASVAPPFHSTPT
ncbi:gamma-glutamyl-gamma-aminobutyrate hydrolase family protein [Cryptosporangium phraense]|uniref:Gamma-glutamyl-gamma-aminobutyrate hydrolase family protein n=1 Tax=Cryptosporangium phraense TaxID=2593070 RepID=A0A545ARF7_9ACTN|nr:gamma-glutamyl-gamma-aminobutyrate hydrolase family protein [Cryptosporangium phraense]TQS43908.1 gamma-glutamyl-gamma-aminobutyrate hydrolase family protein [Cryptosporangium phraense]